MNKFRCIDTENNTFQEGHMDGDEMKFKEEKIKINLPVDISMEIPKLGAYTLQGWVKNKKVDNINKLTKFIQTLCKNDDVLFRYEIQNNVFFFTLVGNSKENLEWIQSSINGYMR